MELMNIEIAGAPVMEWLVSSADLDKPSGVPARRYWWGGGFTQHCIIAIPQRHIISQ